MERFVFFMCLLFSILIIGCTNKETPKDKVEDEWEIVKDSFNDAVEDIGDIWEEAKEEVIITIE